jgi:hemerythrin
MFRARCGATRRISSGRRTVKKNMEWNNEYSVGILELDRQHETLFECITAMEHPDPGTDRGSDTRAALERLTAYARLHFAVEESLMRIHDYPRIDEHINEHLRFSDWVQGLREQALEADTSRDMIKFLRVWLNTHVSTHDRGYAYHFLKRAMLGVS